MLCARALSQRDAVNCVKPLSIAICDATTAVVSALFSIVLFNEFSKVMKIERFASQDCEGIVIR